MSASPGAPNVVAIVSLVLGVLSVMCVCVCYGFPFNIAALICGIIALVQVNGDASQGGKGFAYAGIGLSVLSFLLAVGMLFLGLASGFILPMLENM